MFNVPRGFEFGGFVGRGSYRALNRVEALLSSVPLAYEPVCYELHESYGTIAQPPAQLGFFKVGQKCPFARLNRGNGRSMYEDTCQLVSQAYILVLDCHELVS